MHPPPPHTLSQLHEHHSILLTTSPTPPPQQPGQPQPPKPQNPKHVTSPPQLSATKRTPISPHSWHAQNIASLTSIIDVEAKLLVNSDSPEEKEREARLGWLLDRRDEMRVQLRRLDGKERVREEEGRGKLGVRVWREEKDEFVGSRVVREEERREGEKGREKPRRGKGKKADEILRRILRDALSN
ncbi:MAG: hypothetical protein L6R42_008176 [Xanthoria sp. 1 TBL-2021]|nr:MAG: hypothetical protein L6R42_008176 [Xanthoria sp. 1 TBL-2021]